MKAICLRSTGVSRNKYIGAVAPFGVLPFRLNVGHDEIFEICHADGSMRNAPLLHGETIALKKSGTESFFDMNGSRLSPQACPFVIEKQDALPDGKINDGDSIGLRSAAGWLSSDCHGLKARDRLDWSDAAFRIYEIPRFSGQDPLTLMQSGKAIDFLPLGPHGRPVGGDAHVHVRLDRPAPPGGIIVSFHFDSPEHQHVCIPCILLDGVTEGFAPIHFAHVHEIPESGIRLSIAAEISCTGENSVKFYAYAEGLARKGSVSLSVHKRAHFEPSLKEAERRGADRRVQDRRMQYRRGAERRALKYGLDILGRTLDS
ncbi:MAG: hypothetical protein K2P57_08075 [Burkholderiales bacterium]|nr:hypothetical protein [Burkholderiales bacterium]